MSLFIKQLELGPMSNFVYLVGDTVSKRCAVVDPAWEADKIFSAVAQTGCTLSQVWISHHHPDHTNAVGEVLKQADIPVFIHHEDAGALQDYRENLKPISGGEKSSLGDVEVTFLHTPGHTHGSQCFLIKDRLLTGDTLFLNSCGRVDFPNSDPEKMYGSLRKIGQLPETTEILSGHNYGDIPAATLKEVRQMNHFLTGAEADLEGFLKLVGA